MSSHQDGMAGMKGMHGTNDMKGTMADAMQHTQSHLTSFGTHLSALDAELSVAAPSPKNVSEHATEILKVCAGMMPMQGKAKMMK